jgi:hypothetical protein
VSTHALQLRRTPVVAIASALAGALALLAAMGLVRLADGGGHSASRAAEFSGDGFTIGVPSGWSAARGGAGTAAVLKRADGRGLVIVRQIPAVHGDLRALARDLTAQLRGRVDGFKLVNARLGRIRSGGAFLYTFLRAGRVQSIAVTIVRGRTYRVDSIVAASAPDAARQAGAIVGSFGP